MGEQRLSSAELASAAIYALEIVGTGATAGLVMAILARWLGGG